nr:aldehyde dehydrogenase family protein [Nocardioides convexus]
MVEPRRLDDTGRLWSPGVKTGVRRGSEFHLTEYFGPVLGLIAADDLDEAIAIQNQVDYGLTAGLHSLDRAEIETWVDRVEAGNAYVNRSTVGAIVRRQPFGGWKKSAVGAGTKAGGPSLPDRSQRLGPRTGHRLRPARHDGPAGPRRRTRPRPGRRPDRLPGAGPGLGRARVAARPRRTARRLGADSGEERAAAPAGPGDRARRAGRSRPACCVSWAPGCSSALRSPSRCRPRPTGSSPTGSPGSA